MSAGTDGECCSKIRIERPLYEHDQIRQDFDYEKPKINYLNSQCKLKEVQCQKVLTNTLPILDWGVHYNWRNDLFPDIVAGITLAIMNIPQGMAYAILAKLPPVVGIYTSFFPVIIYIIFGTSKHNSMGTFAIMSLMIGKVVLEHSDSSYFGDNTSSINNTVIATGYSPVQVASALSFVVAIIQIAMFILRLGAVSVLLSDTLVSGFTTGAAIQVLVSQLKDLLGIHLSDDKGNFVVVKTLIALSQSIGEVNYYTLIISVIAISVLLMNVEILKPIVAKRSPVPVPVELVIIIGATLISKFCDLKGEYGVEIVGIIPTGFPEPTPPGLDVIYRVSIDAISIAIVSYTISLSMAMMFAQKLNYEVDANQELLAMGTGNIVGSFFSCMPVSASLTRSMLQVVVGGKTQLVSIICCALLILVMLWLGPVFELVPKCVLASVIVIALNGLLRQVSAVSDFWKLSKMDALVWIVTCFTTIFISIDIGLLVGLTMSLVTIFVLSFKPHTCLLGSIPNSDLYLDSTRYRGCHEISGLKIFQYCGGINFATRTIFRTNLFSSIGMNPQKEIIHRTMLSKETEQFTELNKERIKKLETKVNYSLKCLIIDFSTLNSVDPSGMAMLKSVVESFERIDVPVYIAGCTDPVYNLMEKCGLLSIKSSFLRIFPSVHDAVQCYYNTFNIPSNQRISVISNTT